MKTRVLIIAAMLGALGLGACGKQGLLDRPAPLFGGSARAEYERERAAAARAASDRGDTSATSQTNGDYTHDADGAKDPSLRPLRTDPQSGRPNDPFGTRGAGGVLPDPYADPNRVPR